MAVPVGQLPGIGASLGAGGQIDVGPMPAPGMPPALAPAASVAPRAPYNPADPFGVIGQGLQNLGGSVPPVLLPPESLRAPVPAMQPPAAPMPAGPAPRPMGGGIPAPRGPGSFELSMQGREAELEGAMRLGETQLQAIDIERQRAQREADFFAEQAKADADRMAEDAKRQAQLQADLDKRMTEMDALQAEVRATKIDPSNYFSSQPAWAKMLSLISVGLGGFAQGYSGGRLPNTALDMLNRAIDQDIEAQKANLATKRGAVAEAGNMYGLARQRLGDDRAAAEWVRSQQREMVANTLRRFEAEARDPQLQNKAAQLAVKYETDAQQGRLGIAAMRAGEDERRRAAQAAAMAAAQRGPSLKDLEAIARIKKLEAETGAIQGEAGMSPEGWMSSEKLQARYVPKLGALAATAEEAKELKAKGADRDNLIQSIDRMIKIIEDNPVASRVPGSEARNLLSSARSDILFKTGKAYGAGALSESERDSIEGIYGASNVFDRVEVLKSQRGQIQQNYANLAQQASLIPVEAAPTKRGLAFRVNPGAAPVAPPAFKPAR